MKFIAAQYCMDEKELEAMIYFY